MKGVFEMATKKATSTATSTKSIKKCATTAKNPYKNNEITYTFYYLYWK